MGRKKATTSKAGHESNGKVVYRGDKPSKAGTIKKYLSDNPADAKHTAPEIAKRVTEATGLAVKATDVNVVRSKGGKTGKRRKKANSHSASAHNGQATSQHGLFNADQIKLAASILSVTGSLKSAITTLKFTDELIRRLPK